MGECYVYIMASKRNGTLYVGMTSNIAQRVRRHKNDIGSEFVKQYSVKKMVYYEKHKNVEDALVREKQIKAWKRQWKMRLVEHFNPEWEDLWSKIV